MSVVARRFKLYCAMKEKQTAAVLIPFTVQRREAVLLLIAMYVNVFTGFVELVPPVVQFFWPVMYLAAAPKLFAAMAPASPWNIGLLEKVSWFLLLGWIGILLAGLLVGAHAQGIPPLIDESEFWDNQWMLLWGALSEEQFKIAFLAVGAAFMRPSVWRNIAWIVMLIIVFAALHLASWSIKGSIAAGLIGVFHILFLIWCRNIWAVVIGHYLHNAVADLVSYGPQYIEIREHIITAVVLICALSLVGFCSKVSKEQVD